MLIRFDVEQVEELGEQVQHMFIRCLCGGRIRDHGLEETVICADCSLIIERPHMQGSEHLLGVRVTATNNLERVRLWVASWLNEPVNTVEVEIT